MAQQNQSGAAVASCGGGLFGWLLGLFSSGTPTYAGTGQPVATRCGWGVFGGTPTYQVAPRTPATGLNVSSASETSTPDQGEPAPTEILRPIAIIVRREVPADGDGASAG